MLDYFQPYLGRIEIMGSAGRIERVYFEIKQSNIDQWEKPQIKVPYRNACFLPPTEIFRTMTGCSSYSSFKSLGWLGSRVVSVLDSGAEGLRSNRSRDVVLGKLFTPIVPLLTALLRVARITSGLAESNGSLAPGL